MAHEDLLEKYKEELSDAFSDMRQDPSYAIAIAKQAGSLLNQQELRAQRALNAEDDPASIDE